MSETVGDRPAEPLISLVIPSFNESANIAPLVGALKETLAAERLEIIFVDDGSSDDTLERLRALSARDPACNYVALSRNFGHQLALRAGLDAATGDCVISLDGDMQHPPALIPEMLKHWRAGSDVVLTRRLDGARVPLFKRVTSKVFYGVLNRVFGTSILEGSADFRLLDRGALEALRRFRDPTPFYRGLVGLIGFRQTVLEYEPGERLHGVSKYSLRKMVSLARLGVVSTTVQPLRFAFVFSLVFFAFFIGYAIYVIYTALFGEGAVPGWASVALIVSLIGFGQSLALAILSEYVAQISISARGRPSYIVKERGDRLRPDRDRRRQEDQWLFG